MGRRCPVNLQNNNDGNFLTLPEDACMPLNNQWFLHLISVRQQRAALGTWLA
jgi:hypothetical protein